MTKPTIVVASDHAGFLLKNEIVNRLRDAGYDLEDIGCHDEQSVDYPDYAHAVAAKVAKGEFDRAILVCGTGIGMCIAANKTEGIRCAVCSEEYSARMARMHNDSNVLALGGRVVGPDVAWSIVQTWLETDFAGGRHATRVGKIE